MTTAIEPYEYDPAEPKLVHLVGTARLAGDTFAGLDKPVIMREIHETPDGDRYIRELEFPRGR